MCKSDNVRRLVESGNYKAALGITKGFKRGIIKEDLDKMTLAYECMIYPQFYEQIGTDTSIAINEGVKTLITLYGQNKE